VTNAFIRPGSVKICSLREPDHGRLVVEAGADLFGLIFAPARRQVSVERAAEIVQEARRASSSRSILAVGVFVDSAVGEIEEVVARTGIDLVQLHGDCTPELITSLGVPAVRALRIPTGSTATEIERELDRYAAAPRPPVAFFIDGYREGTHGGQGVRADWALAADLATRWSIMLAGGLAPENVGEAIGAVEPLSVDVSSGVETDGVKDEGKIRLFVDMAKAAFQERI